MAAPRAKANLKHLGGQAHLEGTGAPDGRAQRADAPCVVTSPLIGDQHPGGHVPREIVIFCHLAGTGAPDGQKLC